MESIFEARSKLDEKDEAIRDMRDKAKSGAQNV